MASGFDETSDYWDSGVVHGAGSGSASDGNLDAPSAFESGVKDVVLGPALNIASGFLGDGVYDKVSAAMQASLPGQLHEMSKTWNTVANHTANYRDRLQTQLAALQNAWQGDDADKAVGIISGLHATLNQQQANAVNMSTAVGNMGDNMKQMKDSFHSQSTAGTIGNAFTGSDDREAESAYKQLMETFKSDLGIVPERVPSQIKGSGDRTTVSDTPPPGTGGAGGAPSVGGAGAAPHTGNPTSPSIGKPPDLTTPHPTTHPTTHPETPYDPPTFDDPNGQTNPGPGYDGSSYPGGGAGIGGGAGLDPGGSLAGFDGGGGGGAGSLGGGAGVGVGPDAGGLGAGAGAGTGGGVGTGAAAGLGNGAGGGGSGGGIAGTGGRAGMMPMHGGHGNDDDERERSTWLNEEDDVWGAEENLPGVIS